MRERFVITNGIRMFCVEEGAGPLVLLLHGWPEFWYSWRDQIGPIGAAGFQVVAPDLPGYGRSDKPDVTYDVIWLTDCIAGLIEGLGATKAVVVGHDWGGLIAWSFARLHSDKTAGVIGLNTPDLPRTPIPTTHFIEQLDLPQTQYILSHQVPGQSESAIEADVDGWVQRLFTMWTTANQSVFTDDVLKMYADTFRPRGAIAPTLEYYRNMDRNWELLEEVDDQKIEVPCLMISGESDPVLPAGLAEGMESRVPNLTRVVIEDCGHWTQQEQPEKTTEHMLIYLKSLESW